MSQPTEKNLYRLLSDEEISQLEAQGNTSSDWSLVKVSHNFTTDNIKNSKFTGQVYIGGFNKAANLYGGVKLNAGIYDAWIHNCTVGNNVLIHKVHGYIANYIIEDDVVINNVNTIAVEGETTFGNGVRVKAINEGGGREIPIYDNLSAHIAYIMALYRHRPKLISRLVEMIAKYSLFVKSSMGVIGRFSSITNSNSILNIKAGPATKINGAKKLENGSINSTIEAPVIIGEDVIMSDFIVCSGTQITDAALISNCFIGQGCVISKHYSAENSLFFANCQGFHGEACSIFAGPYTVTHHKSTLLIAGMFSFMNAGSGSNQSNHLYKLGPIHQGIMERGAKTTSDSYILWPARIGAFTLVIGRHYKHSDTTDFPFSYLIESNDKSVLVPAINLKSIGIIRDSQKWPERDSRKDSNLLDLINFNLLSPYTIQKMINGREKLQNIKETLEDKKGWYEFEKMFIEKDALERGIQLYEMAIWKFLGNSLITRLQGKEYKSDHEISKALKIDTPFGKGNWVDIAGLICPFEALNNILKSIENSEITTIEEINSKLTALHKNYHNYEWIWAAGVLEKFTGKSLAEFTAKDIIAVVKKWEESVLGIDKLLYEDAKKEFSMSIKTGFGIDEQNNALELDFINVRGEFEKNETVKAIKLHTKTKKKTGNDLITQMEKI